MYTDGFKMKVVAWSSFFFDNTGLGFTFRFFHELSVFFTKETGNLLLYRGRIVVFINFRETFTSLDSHLVRSKLVHKVTEVLSTPIKSG